MVKNVNRTARLQWKVDTIKNCIYLQCSQKFWVVYVQYRFIFEQCVGEDSEKRQLMFIISMEKSTSHGPGHLFLKEVSIGT